MIQVEQGSDQWRQLRMGCVNASMMDAVFAKPTTKAYLNYLQELVDDFHGVGRFEIEEPWFDAGKAGEPQARLAFSWKFDVDPWNDVLCVHDDFDWLRCSPDMLVGPRDAPIAGYEIKTRQSISTYLAAREPKANSYQGLTRGYYLQVQTAMAITGFQEWGIVNFYVDFNHEIQKLHVRPVLRDEPIITEIIERSVAFRIEALKAAA